MSNPIQVAEVWEDGLRTDPLKRSFEWWYFDANFEDGSTLVVTFYTKQPANSSGPPNPKVEVNLTRPNGEKLNFIQNYPLSEFSAAKDKCDVVMGPNNVSGDLKVYKIHLDLPGFSADVEFDRIAPSYSTRTKDNSKPEYFGWFSAIPYGNVKASITCQGVATSLKGSGYHDHNWGIIDIKDVCQYWYWGRGNAGDYALIFTVMVLPKILGGKHASVFYLAKGEKALFAESDHLELTKTNISPPTPKVGHLPDSLTFTFVDGDSNVQLTLTNPQLLESRDPLADEPWWKKFLTHLFSKPLYVRYNSNLDLEVSVDGKKDSQKGHSLYEIMILH